MVFTKVSYPLSIVTPLFFSSVILSGCTDNPLFSDNKISGGEISGRVELSDGSMADGVYVWLDGFDIGTYTDTIGDFGLTLPSAAIQGGGGGVSGDRYLYFYVANYILDSSRVVLLDGKLANGQGEINEKGELLRTKRLTKLLHVETTVSPSTISVRGDYRIELEITLQAQLGLQVIAVLLKADNRSESVLPALFIRRTDSDENVRKIVDIGTQYVNHIEILDVTPVRLEMAFEIGAGELPPGDYEFIPYIRIKWNMAPAELINNFGSNVEKYDLDYLNLPFKREGGEFRITG